MSRTYKDKPWKHTDPESRWDYGSVRIPYEVERYQYDYIDNEWQSTGQLETVIRYFFLEVAGAKTKKKRSYRERNWMTTPMWFYREFMTQPQRTRGKEWERQVVKVPVDEIIDVEVPNVGRRPKLYYW